MNDFSVINKRFDKKTPGVKNNQRFGFFIENIYGFNVMRRGDILEPEGWKVQCKNKCCKTGNKHDAQPEGIPG